MMTWETLNNIATVVGLFGSAFACFAWIQAKTISRDVEREKQRLNQEIQVVLQGKDENHVIRLPFALRRAELTRSELLGLIGMLPMKKKKGQRYEIKFLGTSRFRETMSQVQDAGDETELIIHCSNDEIEQFDRKMNNEGH